MANLESEKRPDVIWSAASVMLIANAREHARDWGHRFIGSEHLGMALFDDPNVSTILREVGATSEKFSEAITFLVGKGPYYYEPSEIMSFTGRTKRVLQEAERISLESGKTHIEPIDIALGLVISKTDEAGGVLNLLGLTEDKLRS